jgi:hypothetical protein
MLKSNHSWCLGADDRAGIYIFEELIKTCPDKYHYILFDQEESGMLGSKSFAQCELEYHSAFTCYIGLDRRGKLDMVNYGYGNTDLERDFAQFGYQLQAGSCSDVMNLSDCTDIACINLSVGFYNEHSHKEYLSVQAMKHTLKTLQDIELTAIYYTDWGSDDAWDDECDWDFRDKHDAQYDDVDGNVSSYSQSFFDWNKEFNSQTKDY